MKEGFPNLGEPFKQFIELNRLWNYGGPSTKPPDRKRKGNPTRYPPDWPRNTSLRQFISVYMEAGRHFMNLCESLGKLGGAASGSVTDREYEKLLMTLNAIIKKAGYSWFAKPTLAALFNVTGGRIAELKAPESDDGDGATAEISFEVAA